jgi:hypothetical protein
LKNIFCRDKKYVTNKSQQLIDAYAIAGIKRDGLNNAQRRFVDKIVMMLIQKCNREDKLVESVADALKQIPDAIREDPLFS